MRSVYSCLLLNLSSLCLQEELADLDKQLDENPALAELVQQQRDLISTVQQWLSMEPEQDGVYTWRTSFNYTTQMFETLNNYLEVRTEIYVIWFT